MLLGKMTDILIWFLIIIIIILIIILLILAVSKQQSKEDSKEGFSVEYKSDALLKYIKRSGQTTAFYHDPYTYSYIGYGARSQDIHFLPFMCMKFPDKPLLSWSPEDNDPLKMIMNCINNDTCSFSEGFMFPCKTSSVYDLDPSNPIKSAIQNVKLDIRNNMTEYANSTGISILAPVYIILIQYPNKWDTNGANINGYHYSQFDIDDLNPKPCVRRNILTDEHTVCDKADTKMLIIYPMYSKTPGRFYDYGVINDDYNLPLPNDIDMKLKPDIPIKPNFKGIVDMIKFFGRYASKNQICFTECNQNSSLVCGCATRKDGTDNPIANPNSTYKSFCKAPYDPNNNDTRYLFTHYAFMYRVNEREKIINNDSFSNYITDVNIDVETETKINFFLRR